MPQTGACTLLDTARPWGLDLGGPAMGLDPGAAW